MKFTVAITALMALLPLALGAPAPTDIEESNTALGGPINLDVDESLFNVTAQVNELVERKAQSSRFSKLNIKAFKNPGCKGPLVEFNNVKYDARNVFPFKSYTTSRRMKLGETLNLMSGEYGGDKCFKVTSFTPPIMGKGCHEIGGNTAKGVIDSYDD
ncbi:MAG: hypothetical protein Q9185_006811 [Variospora sp. 1 TL-2023]